MGRIFSSVLLFIVICDHHHQSFTGESQLIISPDLISAVAGDDVILPCSLEPPINASQLTVEWARLDVNSNVYLHRHGGEDNVNQNVSYVNRTRLFKDELGMGNVSLKLSRVRLEDEGNYTCLVVKNGKVKKTVIQLRIVVVSKPEVTSMGVNSTWMVLQCVSGVWYPEPELEWRDSEGRQLPADVTQTDRHPDPGPHHRYTVRSNVTVQKTDSNTFTCRVDLQGLNQTRETEIHVPDLSFPLKEESSSIVTVVSIVGVPVVFLGGVPLLICFWKKRTAGSKEFRLSVPEADSQNQDTILHVDSSQPNQETSPHSSSSSQSVLTQDTIQATLSGSVQSPLLPAKGSPPIQ